MLRQFLVICGVLAVAVPPGLGAQAKPDFSGTWKLSSSDPPGYKGGPGAWGAPTPTIVIRQTATDVTVDGLGHGDRTLVFKLDGSDTLTEGPAKSSGGLEAVVKWRTRARWNGKDLVLYVWNTALNQERDVLSLSGTTLTVTRDTESPPPNPPTAKLVYTRAS